MSQRLYQFLEEKEKLTFRAVNKQWLEIARKSERTPYYTKIAFVIGLTGQLNFAKHLSSWTKLWEIYYVTVSSSSTKPACLYKMRGSLDAGKFHAFTEGNKKKDLKSCGRIYHPGYTHFWAINEVWVLAQIHRGRSFTILSPVSDQNKMRRGKHGNKYSAFTKEITSAMMAGYLPTFSAPGQLSLQAPFKIVTRNITVDEIRPDAATIERLYTSLINFEVTKGIALFGDTDQFASFGVIRQLARSFPHLLDEPLKIILSDSLASDVLVNHFLLMDIARYCPQYLENILNSILNSNDKFNRFVADNDGFISVCKVLPDNLVTKLENRFFSDTDLAFHNIKKMLHFIRTAQAFPAGALKMIVYLLQNTQAFRCLVKDKPDAESLIELFPHFAEAINIKFDKCNTHVRYAHLDYTLFSRCVSQHLVATTLKEKQGCKPRSGIRQ